MSFSKLDYCQFLIGSQVNYTLTNLAEHLQSWSHDTINRYLRGEVLPPRRVPFGRMGECPRGHGL